MLYIPGDKELEELLKPHGIQKVDFWLWQNIRWLWWVIHWEIGWN